MLHDIKKGDLTWVDCLTCHGSREHTVGETFKKGGSEPFNWSESYDVLSCNGCKTITFRASASDEDSWNGEEFAVTENFYPPRKTGRASAFGHMRIRHPAIPHEVHVIYQEALAAINNSLPLLAAMGIRLIVEAICKKERCVAYCKKQKVKVNLKNQIDALAHKQIITGKQAKVLHKARFLGNNAAHEILAPTEAEIFAALDITELMLRTIYMLDHIGNRITSTNKTEKREKRWEKQAVAKKAAKLAKTTAPSKP